MFSREFVVSTVARNSVRWPLALAPWCTCQDSMCPQAWLCIHVKGEIMSLLIHDEICINADIGVCKIQLCIGDITKLPKEESVDVLVVSAFPGKQTAMFIPHAYGLRSCRVICASWIAHSKSLIKQGQIQGKAYTVRHMAGFDFSVLQTTVILYILYPWSICGCMYVPIIHR